MQGGLHNGMHHVQSSRAPLHFKPEGGAGTVSGCSPQGKADHTHTSEQP